MRANDRPVVEVQAIFRHEARKLIDQFMFTIEDQITLDRIINNAGGDLTQFLWVLVSGAFLNIDRVSWVNSPTAKAIDDYCRNITASSEVLIASDVLCKKSNVLEIDASYSDLDARDHRRKGHYGALQTKATDRFEKMIEELYYYLGLDELKVEVDSFAFCATRDGIVVAVCRD